MWSALRLAIAMALPMQQPADLDAVMQRASAYVAQYEAEAFEDSPANNSKRLLQMKTESSQYNLGNILREINLPTFALKILRQGEIERFNFEKSGTEKVSGVSTWVVHFAERGLQTLVRGDHGERLYSTGTLWIDPLTGRVLKTEFIVENPFAEPPVKARTIVNYTRGKTVDLLVPRSMQEHYEFRGSAIDCLADYSDFRRFEVDVKFDFGPTKPR
jgi:hypothetical protein